MSGVAVNSDNQTILPFVNISIKKKKIGASSLADGTFLIKIPTQNENDTLTFSMIGYSEINLPIKDIVKNHQTTFQLKAKSTELKSVVITAQKLVEQKFGIKCNGLFHLGDASTNQNDIFEIAQLIKLDTSLSKITSVNLQITKSKTDSRTFRINFYSYDGNRPIKRIVE